jgi:hypothetical protein
MNTFEETEKISAYELIKRKQRTIVKNNELVRHGHDAQFYNHKNAELELEILELRNQ